MFGLLSANSSIAQSISTYLTTNWTPIGAEAPELPGNISPFISSFEIRAHLAAGQTARALELIRRSWGWYLNHPNGTGSTVVEGYRTDGTWGYGSETGNGHDASYVSHAHGWSSGPTGALTENILGLAITGRSGETWRFAPQFGDLSYAQGGFVTDLGKFEAKWTRKGGDGGSGYEATVNTPEGTKGLLVFPGLRSGVKPNIQLGGKAVSGNSYGKRAEDNVVGLVSVEAVWRQPQHSCQRVASRYVQAPYLLAVLCVYTFMWIAHRTHPQRRSGPYPCHHQRLHPSLTRTSHRLGTCSPILYLVPATLPGI